MIGFTCCFYRHMMKNLSSRSIAIWRPFILTVIYIVFQEGVFYYTWKWGWWDLIRIFMTFLLGVSLLYVWLFYSLSEHTIVRRIVYLLFVIVYWWFHLLLFYYLLLFESGSWFWWMHLFGISSYLLIWCIIWFILWWAIVLGERMKNNA